MNINKQYQLTNEYYKWIYNLKISFKLILLLIIEVLTNACKNAIENDSDLVVLHANTGSVMAVKVNFPKQREGYHISKECRSLN